MVVLCEKGWKTILFHLLLSIDLSISPANVFVDNKAQTIERGKILSGFERCGKTAKKILLTPEVLVIVKLNERFSNWSGLSFGQPFAFIFLTSYNFGVRGAIRPGLAKKGEYIRKIWWGWSTFIQLFSWPELFVNLSSCNHFVKPRVRLRRRDISD